MNGETALPRPRLAQGTLLLASMLTIMAGATISPALPAIQREFSTAPNAPVLVGLVLTMHGLFIAVGSPAIGALADRHGRRWLLLVSTVIYALAGGSGFVLDSLVAILVGRAVLGLAVGGIMVTVTALITDYYETNRRETILGRQGACMSLGGVVLLPLAGVLADISWRAPFLVYTVALVLLPAMAFALPEPTRRDPTGDRPTSINELRHTLARFPLRTLALIITLGLIGQIIFYMIPVQMPFYLEAQTGVRGSLIGTALAVSTGAGGVASLLYGRIRRSVSVIGIVALTFAFMSMGYLIIGVSGTFFGIVAGLVFAGAGSGFLLTNLNAWIAAVTPESVRGRALSGLTSAFFLGQFLSPLVVRPVSDIVGLGGTFLSVGVVLAGGAVVFALTAVSVTPPTESEHESAEQSRLAKENTVD
ncbi:MFS transporter [Natrialba asiatica]|uniref:Major facilitator superfamily protein n=1 Tax=Natrialba asiatica (strain ATCC 700177 / DSM 12278 / JCM 9576 / FERM P-10747 / NBRC 102637 / 172P1) TaxID=29540 RepID=M0B553_NATA1|nr:MFS transporter [Natrialba asiatica]ELZ05940.1 major facilitator superfamily protein [Natrialba asiatica DSM 12278]